MAETTKIAWTDATCNFWMGCQKWSRGCDHCYADTWTSGRMGLDVFGGRSKRKRTSKQLWNRPRRWNEDASLERHPHRVFCMSLGDFFEDAPGPNEWRAEAWEVIHSTPWLDWQILTKRPENIERMLPDSWADNRWGYWPNVWLGTSIEDNRVAERSSVLTQTPAIVHFISYEPAIGPGDEIPLDDIEWLICGGESGPGYRKMDIMWAFDMHARCELSGTAFFFKQYHGPRTEMGIDAMGQVIRAYPHTWDRRTYINSQGR